MAITLTLTADHGYVLAVAILANVAVFWMSTLVSSARAKAKMPYPYMYASKAEAEADHAKHLFNCAQRAHQNTLENFPTFLTVLAISSIQHPQLAAISGLVWVVGKVFYALGYAGGDPNKRYNGAFSYLGFFALLGTSIKTAYVLATGH